MFSGNKIIQMPMISLGSISTNIDIAVSDLHRQISFFVLFMMLILTINIDYMAYTMFNGS